MKKSMSLIFLLVSLLAWSQDTDTILNRDVTVEREFQPVIRQAGKINQRPVEAEFIRPQQTDVEYSDYTTVLTPADNINSLLSQPMRFRAVGEDLCGELRAAIGHPQTLLDFSYLHSDGRRNSLRLRVEHEAEWGLRTVEHSALGLDYSHSFSTGKVYFTLEGVNRFFTRYGRYYNDSLRELTVERYHELRPEDKQAIWQANATLGIQSNQKQDLQYKAELSYRLYDIHSLITEHQANARLNMQYKLGDHKVGGNLYSQNQFMNPSDSLKQIYESTGKTYNSRHAVRIEPFYEYRGRRVFVHAGINLDFNVGKGNQFSATNDSTPLARQVAFAPSPNVRLEAQLAPKWAILYADIRGTLGMSSMSSYTNACLYQDYSTTVISHHVSGYVPVDAELGFMFRPYHSLLLQVHAGYKYAMNQSVFAPSLCSDSVHAWNTSSFLYTDFHRWKIGAQVAFHYRDYVDIHVWGDYYIYQNVRNNTANKLMPDKNPFPYTENRIYDRPNWELGCRIDGHIDNHWSVYTHSSFQGRRWAITALGDRDMKAFIDVNLGAGYQFAGTGNKALDRLSLFAELQNILHRRNMIWYGYESEGIHGRIGLNWKF